LNEELLQALSQVIDIRDPYVLGHSHHVVEYAVKIAQKMKISPERVERIRKAGMLHDIGKCGIQDSILYKPGRLDPYEYEIIKQHTVIGAEIIAKVGELRDLVPIIRHHHERIDGKGYPDGLSGEEIPLEARIMALADAIEAMASDRLYKKALKPEEILDEIERCKGTQFDPKVVEAFAAIVRQEGLSIIRNSAMDENDDFAVNWWIPEDRRIESKPN
jgi:putative nucleotidyltransferase with HDIG domain